MLSWRDRERIKTEEVLRRSATQSEQKSLSIDYPKWGSLGVSIFALIVSACAFYSQTIREVHDFRAIDFGSGVLLINAGNRTEALAEARFLYSDADWRPGDGGELGKSTGPVVLKPGEAQIIELEPTPTDKLDPPLRTSRHISIDFVIVDTRTGSTGNKVFLESVHGVNIVHEEQSEGPSRAVPRGRPAGHEAEQNTRISSVEVKVVGGSSPGRFDTTSYVQLYEGERLE
jgi:hypothetical protein